MEESCTSKAHYSFSERNVIIELTYLSPDFSLSMILPWGKKELVRFSRTLYYIGYVNLKLWLCKNDRVVLQDFITKD